MKRHRCRKAAAVGGLPLDQNGIMDVLANLVGVLTLVGALSAIIIVNASLRIRTPLAQETYKRFVALQAGEAGIWNLQPAMDLGNNLKHVVASQVSLRCLLSESNYFSRLLDTNIDINCLERRTKSINKGSSSYFGDVTPINIEGLGSGRTVTTNVTYAKSLVKSAFVDIIFDSDSYVPYNIENLSDTHNVDTNLLSSLRFINPRRWRSHLFALRSDLFKSLKVRTQRSEKPTYAIEDLEKDDSSLRRQLNQAAAENKAIYVFLAKEGFPAYQKIRSVAAANNLQVGWEPWGTGEPVLWTTERKEGVRSMNVQ